MLNVIGCHILRPLGTTNLVLQDTHIISALLKIINFGIPSISIHLKLLKAVSKNILIDHTLVNVKFLVDSHEALDLIAIAGSLEVYLLLLAGFGVHLGLHYAVILALSGGTLSELVLAR